MKILIVTHPLGNNYGGLLQAYALQQVLKGLGYSPWIMNVGSESLKIKVLRQLRNTVYTLLGRFYVTQRDKDELSHNMTYFAKTYITPQTPVLQSRKAKRNYLVKNGFNAVIVGSDQVWRPIYLNNIFHYFLDFTEGLNVKRISYAASFGVDLWEFSVELTNRCRKLIAQFDAISVREVSGVTLCKEHLHRDATLVLDPTLLLPKEHYVELIGKEKEPMVSGDMFCYILDKSEDTKRIVDEISLSMKYQPYYCMPDEVEYSKMTKYNKKSFVYPPVTQWLRSIMDAKMVLTDSFHGCVFSIIFNKPFWIVVNKNRGAARFSSLLNLFGLENRIVKDDEVKSKDWNEPIDWNNVNPVKEQWKGKSLQFLHNNL